MGKVPPLVVLQERAEARAILFHEWHEWNSFEEAIADLLAYALEHDLTDQIGADGVFNLIDAAFEKVFHRG
jgi:hypothetical protein